MDNTNRSQNSLLNIQTVNSNVLDTQLIFSKKRKLDEESPISVFDIISEDVLAYIFTFLTYQNLLILERTEKRFLNPILTQSFWKNQKVINYLDFNWSMCSKELHRDRCEFRINKAIYRFFSNNDDLTWKFQDSSELFSKHEKLIDRFSFLDSIIKTGINRYIIMISENYREKEHIRLGNQYNMPNPKEIPELDLTFFNNETKISNEFVNACSHNLPGESMLHGLMLCSDIDKNKIQIMNCFKKAIETNASCTSLFLCSGPFNNTLPFHDQLNLALQSAKLGDERALWALQNNKEDLKLTENDYIKKTFTFFWLGTRDWNEEAHLHVLELLKGLKIPILCDSLGDQLSEAAADYAYKNKNLLLAEEFYDQAIKAYGDNINCGVFGRAAYVKIKLKKFEEADKLVDLSINHLFNRELDGHCGTWNNESLIRIAHLKSKLGKFEAAYHLFDLALNGSNQNNILALSNLMNSVVKSKKFETDNLFVSLIPDFYKLSSLYTIVEVGSSQLKIGQFEMAKRLFDLVIKGNENDLTTDIIEIVLNAKKKLVKINKTLLIGHV